MIIDTQKESTWESFNMLTIKEFWQLWDHIGFYEDEGGPHKFQWLAQDKSGQWCIFNSKPIINIHENVWSCNDEYYKIYMPLKFDGDWAESLHFDGEPYKEREVEVNYKDYERIIKDLRKQIELLNKEIIHLKTCNVCNTLLR